MTDSCLQAVIASRWLLKAHALLSSAHVSYYGLLLILTTAFPSYHQSLLKDSTVSEILEEKKHVMLLHLFISFKFKMTSLCCA